MESAECKDESIRATRRRARNGSMEEWKDLLKLSGAERRMGADLLSCAATGAQEDSDRNKALSQNQTGNRSELRNSEESRVLGRSVKRSEQAGKLVTHSPSLSRTSTTPVNRINKYIETPAPFQKDVIVVSKDRKQVWKAFESALRSIWNGSRRELPRSEIPRAKDLKQLSSELFAASFENHVALAHSRSYYRVSNPLSSNICGPFNHQKGLREENSHVPETDSAKNDDFAEYIQTDQTPEMTALGAAIWQFQRNPRLAVSALGLVGRIASVSDSAGENKSITGWKKKGQSEIDANATIELLHSAPQALVQGAFDPISMPEVHLLNFLGQLIHAQGVGVVSEHLLWQVLAAIGRRYDLVDPLEHFLEGLNLPPERPGDVDQSDKQGQSLDAMCLSLLSALQRDAIKAVPACIARVCQLLDAVAVSSENIGVPGPCRFLFEAWLVPTLRAFRLPKLAARLFTIGKAAQSSNASDGSSTKGTVTMQGQRRLSTASAIRFTSLVLARKLRGKEEHPLDGVYRLVTLSADEAISLANLTCAFAQEMRTKEMSAFSESDQNVIRAVDHAAAHLEYVFNSNNNTLAPKRKTWLVIQTSSAPTLVPEACRRSNELLGTLEHAEEALGREALLRFCNVAENLRLADLELLTSELQELCGEAFALVQLRDSYSRRITAARNISERLARNKVVQESRLQARRRLALKSNGPVLDQAVNDMKQPTQFLEMKYFLSDAEQEQTNASGGFKLYSLEPNRMRLAVQSVDPLRCREENVSPKNYIALASISHTAMGLAPYARDVGAKCTADSDSARRKTSHSTPRGEDSLGCCFHICLADGTTIQLVSSNEDTALMWVFGLQNLPDSQCLPDLSGDLYLERARSFKQRRDSFHSDMSRRLSEASITGDVISYPREDSLDMHLDF